MDRQLKILNVEDSERDSVLLERHLRAAGFDFVWKRVETEVDLRSELTTEEWNIILCDYSMPRFSAMAALAVLRESEADIPFIIISGTVGEEIAVEALLSGANDYIPKGNLARLAPAIQREVKQAEDRRAKGSTEGALEASEAELRALFEAMNDAILVFDVEGRHLKVAPTNPKHVYRREIPRIGKTVHEIFPPKTADFMLENIRTCVVESRTLNVEHELPIDGMERWFNCTVTPLTQNSVLWVARDVTHRKRAEHELRENESLLAATQRITHLGSWVMDLSDPEGGKPHKERWSDEHYRIYGLEPGQVEITDEVFYNSIHPDDRALLANKIREAIDDALPFDLEHRILLPDGRERTVQAMAEVVLDDRTGKALRLLGSVQDITDRKLTQAALAESEKRFRSVVETAPDVIVTIDDKSKSTSLTVQLRGSLVIASRR